MANTRIYIDTSNIIYSVEVITVTGAVTTRRKYLTHLMQSLNAIAIDPDAQGLVPELIGHCALIATSL
jgi:hypothetical protein